MLFRHDIHGWHYSDDSEEMKKAGWKESSDAEFKAFVAAKNKKPVEVKQEVKEEVKEVVKEVKPEVKRFGRK